MDVLSIIFFLLLLASVLFWLFFLYLIAHYLVIEDFNRNSFLSHFKKPCFQTLILSGFLFLFLLFKAPSSYLFTFLFFISLLITISLSDICTMLISTFLTLGAIPLGFLAAYYDYSPISITESIFGAIGGYSALWLFSYCYKQKTDINGIGEGDLDMLAMIGSFLGFYGAWISLTVGSLLGSLIGLIYYFKNKKFQQDPLPFGPLLALGSYCYIIYLIFFNKI